MAAQTNAVSEDPEWFADSGANAHITNNLNNLTIQQPFEGKMTQLKLAMDRASI